MDELKEMEGVNPEDSKKLAKLIEKEAKTSRSLTGVWKVVVSVLSLFMVLFYFYAAGVASVGVQYHIGIYVFITYILVFLLYPAGQKSMRVTMNLITALVLVCTLAILFYYNDPAAFHVRMMEIFDAWSDEEYGQAFSSFGALWPMWLAVIGLTAVLFGADKISIKYRGQSPTPTDTLLAIISGLMVYYWISQFEALNYRAGAETELDSLISIVGVLLSLEVCRRVLGWSMTLVGVFFICYALFGPYLPEILAHRGFGVQRLSNALFLTTNGIFGVMANVLATYVILFIFFGAFLHKSGAGKFFIDLPLALAGRSTGGPAKVAVIASALFGSVSGSAIANTVSTGAFTIPLMKRAGFKAHVAGAIEPSASIGGMFLPPVMGAGGFLMAELTGNSYAYIMLVSVVPALLYFFSVFAMIHFEAKKQGIKGILDDEFPHWKTVLKEGWFYSLPLVIITILMIIGRSPGYAAFWATLTCIVISWVRKDTRMGIKQIWEAIQSGAKNTLIIGATVGVIGIIVGTISLTGIGLKFSDIIISVAGDNLFLAVILIGLASLVLGMGVPVTAAYLIVAVLAVPALGAFGVAAIAAHQIVYWFSQDSNITPPVCVAAFAGAAIAGSDPWKTGWTCFKFAKLLYVMPLLFAFTPAILFMGTPTEIIFSFVSAILGTLAFSSLTMAYLIRKTSLVEWLIFAVATVCLYWPTIVTDLTGIVLVAIVYMMQKRKNNREALA